MASSDQHQHLDRQICFPLYVASRLLTRLYQPWLEPLGLTYPQYIVMLILWEDAPCSVTHIGARAQLATNTLTPLLKRLEQSRLIERQRSPDDERVVKLSLTPEGRALKKKCSCLPMQLFEKVGYTQAEARALKAQVDELVTRLSQISQTMDAEP